jgi:hypothetical protein
VSEEFEGSIIRSSSPTGFRARGQFGIGDGFLPKDLLELKGNHALERQNFHLGENAFGGEEFAEVTAIVGILKSRQSICRERELNLRTEIIRTSTLYRVSAACPKASQSQQIRLVC